MCLHQELKAKRVLWVYLQSESQRFERLVRIGRLASQKRFAKQSQGLCVLRLCVKRTLIPASGLIVALLERVILPNVTRDSQFGRFFRVDIEGLLEIFGHLLK